MGMRPYWADYANHMLRFFCKNDDPTMVYRFRSRTDEKNWRACQRVMSQLGDHDRALISEVYNSPLLLADAVEDYLTTHPKEDSKGVWNIICDVSKRVAQMRGLVS